MPLVRYELRCEHSLANPELCRFTEAAAAGSDDDDDDDVSSQGLLEGVAAAGLVGIIRQLGNLAEFAGEIFCELHEQLTALRRRGNGLKSRLLKLETELPAIEKQLRNSTDQFRYNYIAGAQWHPILSTKQNHLTKSDLPNFVRNFYDNCRGPPRLFLLDKFDVAGEGACMKRYTDPSFYTTLSSGSAFKRKAHNQSWSKKENYGWCKTRLEIQGSFLCFSHRKRSSFPHSRISEYVYGATMSPQIPITEQGKRITDGEVGDELSPELLGENKTEADEKKILKEDEERKSDSDGEYFVDALAMMDSGESSDMDDLWYFFTPINLSEVDDDLGYEKHSPCRLMDDLGYEKYSPCRPTDDLAPSFLDQFACDTHTIESHNNPLTTSASSPTMSYSAISESVSQEESEYMKNSLVMSPWSKVSCPATSYVFPDSSSGSDDNSFRIHSVQSLPIVPIGGATSSPTTTHSQKHSKVAPGLLAAATANAVQVLT